MTYKSSFPRVLVGYFVRVYVLLHTRFSVTSDVYLMQAPLRWYDTLKYGNFNEKLDFLKIQDLRPLNTCRKHFEVILLIFL